MAGHINTIDSLGEVTMDVDLVKKLIKESFNITEVLLKMGYNKSNTTQRVNLMNLMKNYNIDYRHFKRIRKSKWSDVDKLSKLVKRCKSMREFIEQMGLEPKGSNLTYARDKLKHHQIDFSHFGKKPPYKNYLTVPLQQILEGKHPTYSRHSLKARLLKEGLKQNVCEECGLDNEWHGKKIVMHLDHKNGIHNDHKLKNLRMLCPNCHSQTPTYAGRTRNKTDH